MTGERHIEKHTFWLKLYIGLSDWREILYEEADAKSDHINHNNGRTSNSWNFVQDVGRICNERYGRRCYNLGWWLIVSTH